MTGGGSFSPNVWVPGAFLPARDGANVRAMDVALRETKVHDRVLVFTQGGDDLSRSFGSNATAILGDGTVAVVDPFVSPVHARALESALAERGAGRVRLVILTHHHTDHALGAAYFGGKGAMVVCHRECGLAMKAEHPRLLAERRKDPAVAALFKGAASVTPHLVFDSKEPQSLNVGPLRVEFLHVGPAHTKGDVIVRIPKLSIVVTGDLVSSGYHVNLEDADLTGFVRALERLLDLDAKVYVPGHGAPGGKELVEAQVSWLVAARDAAREAKESGAERGTAALRVVTALEARYPAHLLRSVLPVAAERLLDALA